MLAQFSIVPLIKGESLSGEVARILERVEKSGLEYRLTPMATVVEGDFDEVMGLITDCHKLARESSRRVLTTIMDTHITGLIAAAFLFQFGTGPIKGFAVTVVIGYVANLFASYFLSRFLFEWVLGKRHVEKLSI